MAATGEALTAERVAQRFGEIAGEPEGQADRAIGLIRPLIGDADLDPAVPADRGDHERLAGRAALQRIGEQAGQDPGEERGVGDHLGQVLGRAQRDLLAARPQVVQARGHHLVKIDRPQVGLDRPGVQPAQIGEVVDHPAHLVHRVARRGEQGRVRAGRAVGLRGRQRRERCPGRGQLLACGLAGSGDQRRPRVQVHGVPGGLGLLVFLAPVAEAGHDLGRAGKEHPQAFPAGHRPAAGQRERVSDRQLYVCSRAFRRLFAGAGHDVTGPAGAIGPPFEQADRGQAGYLAHLLEQGRRVAVATQDAAREPGEGRRLRVVPCGLRPAGAKRGKHLGGPVTAIGRSLPADQVNVDVLGPARQPGRDALAGDERDEAAAAARAEHHLGGVLGAGETQQRIGHVVTWQQAETAA